MTPQKEVNNLTAQERLLIGKRLRALRKKKNWGQKQLQSEMQKVRKSSGPSDFSVRQISRAENGRGDVDIGFLHCMANALGTTLEDLLVVETASQQQGQKMFYENIKARVIELASLMKRNMKFLLVGIFALLIIGGYIVSFHLGKASNPKPEPKPPNQSRDQSLTTGTPDERQEIENALRANFLHELEIYKNPEGFDESQLSNYWVPEEKGGTIIVKVKNAVKRLKDNGLHYGPESTYEELVFTSIQISPSGEYAEVRTRERLYQPRYNSQGERLETKNTLLTGSYLYTLKKLNGRWLLLHSNVPYAGQ